MTDEILLAYLAGAIDSDGTIGIKRSTYAMRRRGDAGQPIYSERIALRHVTPEVPTLLLEAFGGGLRVEAPQGPNRRPMYGWAVTDLNATAALRALRPHLRVKHRQADNCLELRALKDQSRLQRLAVGRGHVGGAARSANLSAAMEAAYLEAKRLNAVGVLTE